MLLYLDWTQANRQPKIQGTYSGATQPMCNNRVFCIHAATATATATAAPAAAPAPAGVVGGGYILLQDACLFMVLLVVRVLVLVVMYAC